MNSGGRAGAADGGPGAAPEEPYCCGFAAVVGRPNVGKSTLVNRIVGQKLSITTRRAQTTRHRILGIRTTATHQSIYVDTPGLHAGGVNALNRYLNRTARSALQAVDVVVFVVEALRWTREDAFVAEGIAQTRAPVILVVNKSDRVRRRADLLPYIEQSAARGGFAEIVPVSATRGENVERLDEVVGRYLPPGRPEFPADQVTDRSERFLAAEFIREKLMRSLGEELPYHLTVEIERFAEKGGLVEIDAVVWVEKPGQKAIVIGRAGRTLKRAGSGARRDLEALLGRKVYLNLWVRVRRGWSDDERALRELGYHD